MGENEIRGRGEFREKRRTGSVLCNRIMNFFFPLFFVVGENGLKMRARAEHSRHWEEDMLVKPNEKKKGVKEEALGGMDERSHSSCRFGHVFIIIPLSPFFFLSSIRTGALRPHVHPFYYCWEKSIFFKWLVSYRSIFFKIILRTQFP